MLSVFTFSFALWLGLYLINRNILDSRLRLAGAGLVAYAAALALEILSVVADTPTMQESLLKWQRPFLFIPALCWLALLTILLRGQEAWHTRLNQHPRPTAVILTASIFFALGLGLLLFPVLNLPHFWLILAVGGDLLALGATIAVLDAFDEGETLAPHLIRSLTFTSFTALLFGGQVALMMRFIADNHFALWILLLSTLTAAIVIQTFSDAFATLLDRIALLRQPNVRQTSKTLRAAIDIAPRTDPTLDLNSLDEKEFIRLTRRALGNMNNLPKLAASPLTHLPVVESRAERNGRSANTLSRASELKAILTESILRLKPRGEEAFGTSGEWRHYNALYFPYVLGMKPFSRRFDGGRGNEEGETAVRAIRQWFQTQVPPRTLYNWQNAAAKLVAQDLREKGASKVPFAPT